MTALVVRLLGRVARGKVEEVHVAVAERAVCLGCCVWNCVGDVVWRQGECGCGGFEDCSLDCGI